MNVLAPKESCDRRAMQVLKETPQAIASSARMRRAFKMQICVCVTSILGWLILGHDALAGRSHQREVRVFNWSGLIGARTISDFEKRLSAKVAYETYNSNEELHAKLKAGASYDVVFPSTYMVQILIRDGLLQPLDKSRLANLSHLSKQFLHWPFDPENTFFVALSLGTTGLGVNHERVGRKSADLDLLFRTEYKGKISMLEGMRFTLGIALKHLGFSVNSTRAADLAKA
jgi:spermidine/putrescine-binding protein